MKRLWKAMHSVLVVLQYVVFVPLALSVAPFVAMLFGLVMIREAVEAKVAQPVGKADAASGCS